MRENFHAITKRGQMIQIVNWKWIGKKIGNDGKRKWKFASNLYSKYRKSLNEHLIARREIILLTIFGIVFWFTIALLIWKGNSSNTCIVIVSTRLVHQFIDLINGYLTYDNIVCKKNLWWRMGWRPQCYDLHKSFTFLGQIKIHFSFGLKFWNL